MFILSSLKLNVVISLDKNINAIVSRIVIGTLDFLKNCQNFSIFADVSKA